jgi:hypothetical protein
MQRREVKELWRVQAVFGFASGMETQEGLDLLGRMFSCLTVLPLYHHTRQL